MAAWVEEEGRRTVRRAVLAAHRMMLVHHTGREAVRRTDLEVVRHIGLVVVLRIDLAEGHTGPAVVRNLVVLAGRSLVAEGSFGSSFATDVEGVLSGAVAVMSLYVMGDSQ